MIIPRIVTGDVEGLVEFLKSVFGAAGEAHDDRPATITIGDAQLLISKIGPRPATGAFLYIYVDDCDATHARAVRLGARELEAPFDTPYGDRRGMIEDRWGNVWQIATRNQAL